MADGNNNIAKILLKTLKSGLRKKLIIVGLIILVIISFTNLELWDDKDDGLISRKKE